MTLNPGDTYIYNNQEWTISLVTSTHVTIERGNKWLCLTRK